MQITLTHEDGKIRGELTLAGSKSISNRALIIRALCPSSFEIGRLANAKDTRLLDELLQSDHEILDAGAAGTTFRFLTAYLAMKEGTQVLTGSARMKERPIGVLVEALRQLGADIAYLEREGFPPLRIGSPKQQPGQRVLRISAGTSSQYISALLMIAPTLPEGLELVLEGRIVSRPYIEMTLALMGYFGVTHSWEGSTIRIAPQSYVPRSFTVEADWSAASYYYAMAALSESAELTLHGVYKDSLQGDSILPDMYELLGVYTQFLESGIRLTKAGHGKAREFEWDFLRCPDLAQTLAVTCAALGIPGHFSGVETLRIKETDRIGALRDELAKVGVAVHPVSESGKEEFHVAGLAHWDLPPVFDTYEDHRMAMAFAPLALIHPICIADPGVVDKSYPDFWEDLKKLGFRMA